MAVQSRKSIAGFNAQQIHLSALAFRGNPITIGRVCNGETPSAMAAKDMPTILCGNVPQPHHKIITLGRVFDTVDLALMIVPNSNTVSRVEILESH